MLILQHKLIDLFKRIPKQMSEFLKQDYEIRSREKWTENVFR